MSTWVLLRGLTRESRHWGELPRHLEAAVGASRMVALDLPGNGRLHRAASPTSVRAMAEWVRAELRAQALPPPYHLFAMSLGAMVGLAWTHAHPRELAALVLVNTSVGRLNPPHRRLRWRAWPALLRLAVPGLDDAERERRILGLTSARHAGSAAPAEWVACRREHPVSTANALRQLWAAARFRPPRHAPNVPVLLLSGARDALVDPACSRLLARTWGVRHAEHARAGHDLPLDDASWVAEQVGCWLGAAALPAPQWTHRHANS